MAQLTTTQVLKQLLSRHSRLLRHIAFWMLATAALTLTYGIGMPNYEVAFYVILEFMPIHMLYFYAVSSWAIPRYFYTKKYIKLFLAVLSCTFLAALAFRLLEITVADPYIYKMAVANNEPFVWHKLVGTFWEQLGKRVYIINALEQSNLVIWIALFIKFIMMWYDKRQVATQAELNFLKSQIHPHFLFNTLNNLYALTLNQSTESPAVVLGLSNILRYMLYECSTDEVPLKRDVEILESYIGLEKIRYEQRLDLNFSVTGNIQNQRIPPLLMLPLVENAFKHGTSETIHGAWININLQVSDKKLVFKVSNSKPETTPEDSEQHFGKIGLSNVRKRLELLHNPANQLHVYEEEDLYVTILELDLYY
jgi:hypothetical protein